MKQYYIATEEGQTEGPYSFASLEAFMPSKITQKSLVCIAGGQEWVQFGTVLEQKWKEKSEKVVPEKTRANGSNINRRRAYTNC